LISRYFMRALTLIEVAPVFPVEVMMTYVSADGNPLVTTFVSWVSCSIAGRRRVLSYLIWSVNAFRVVAAWSANAFLNPSMTIIVSLIPVHTSFLICTAAAVCTVCHTSR
jgi:hypothetical protein